MRRLAMIVLVMALMAGAQGPIAAKGPESLNHKALKNAEYPLAFGPGGVVRLTNGKYEDQARKTKVELRKLEDGDLNNNGVSDAVLLFSSTTGGAEVFLDLVAVMNREGKAQSLPAVRLGDRVKVQSIGIRAGFVVVELLTHSPEDAPCCPTQPDVKSFEVRGDRLVDVMTPR